MIFDVEGVLLPNRYLTYELGRNLSFPRRVKFFFFGLLYEVGLLTLESALKRIFKLFRGFNQEEILNIFRKAPLHPNTEVVFTKLREIGLKTAIISSGLPQVVVENLASRLKTNYAFGLELETNNNLLTGNIKGDVILKNGKAIVMKKILAKENLTPQECVVIADDHNNLPIFHRATLKIGCNPDFLIALKSDFVIKQDLLEIIPIIKDAPRKRQFSLPRNDVFREIIHASGFLVAFATIHFGPGLVACLLSLTAIVYAASELARTERKNMPLIPQITLNAATFSERYAFATAPIFLAVGLTLSILVFPPPINYASIAIVSLGDSAAAIFGKVFGKTPIPFNKGKNLEGTLAGFAFAFFGAGFFLNPLLAFVSAIAGMLTETLPLPINDNISVPLVTGALLTFLLSFT